MWLYAAFLACTIGADDFDTRDAWTDFFRAVPLLRPLFLPGTMWDDPEVAHRCVRITGHRPPWYMRDDLARRAYFMLYAAPADAAVDAEWWGSHQYPARNLLLERVARESGIILGTETIPYGVAAMEKWLRICRHRVRGLTCREDPKYAVEVAPEPKEKKR